MSNNISLTASMRSNLLSLQNVSKQIDVTQNRLSTGKKVNSAIDNPSSYYTARALNNRADDLNALLDSMGQAVSTVKAANEAIETSLSLLEQMKSVAEQALENPVKIEETAPTLQTKELDEYLAEGYTAITADMTAADINALITDGAKLVLAEDIVLDYALEISGVSDVTIDGNGHKITYDDTGIGESDIIYIYDGASAKISNIELDYTTDSDGWGATIWVSDSGTNVDVSSVKITVHNDNSYGVYVVYGAKATLDSTGGIEMLGANSQKVVGNSVADLYDGKGNTQKILAQLGNKALAAAAANQFYVGDKNGVFGQGKWYLPAIGEWAELYGTDTTQISDEYYGTSGAIGDNKTAINKALTIIASKGADAEALSNSYYWSASEYGRGSSW